MMLAAVTMAASAKDGGMERYARQGGVMLSPLTRRSSSERDSTAVRGERLDSAGRDDTIRTMREVTVKAARTVARADGMWIYPTKQQLERSSDGYSLLAKLALPRIRVDEAMNTVTALTNLGSVQVRINDVVATKEELLSLDLRGVQRVEYVDNPGLRYGEGIACVINLKVRRPDSGYVLGAALTNTLTTILGDESLYARVNRGRSEWALNYGLDFHRLTGEEYDEHASYLLGPTASASPAQQIHRRLTGGRSSSLGHKVQLVYSLSDSAYVLQARLALDGHLRPARTERTMETDGETFTNQTSSRRLTPSVDLYYHQDFRSRQSLTANVVMTRIRSSGQTENNEGTPYAYETDGRTHALWGEAVYDHRFRLFTLSAGLQLNLQRSRNIYEGDASATNVLHTAGTYFFSQLQGELARLTYMAGLGVSLRHYSQGDRRQDFWLFRPKFNVGYALTDRLRLRYGFEISQHVSQIALVSDVSIKVNRLETLVGNPDLRPNRVTSHDVHLTYTTPRLTVDLQGYARLNAHCNMEQYIRREGHFLQTQSNGNNQCNLFYGQLYGQWQLVPECLSISVYGGLYRFYNRGADYVHTYNSFNGGASVQANVGRWTLSAYADNGWHFMEGEHRSYGAPAWYLTASYRFSRAVSCSLFAQHLFARRPVVNDVEVLNRYVHKDVIQRQRDYGNMITLKVAVRLEHGRRYRDIQRSMNHTDRETGILSK